LFPENIAAPLFSLEIHRGSGAAGASIEKGQRTVAAGMKLRQPVAGQELRTVVAGKELRAPVAGKALRASGPRECNCWRSKKGDSVLIADSATKFYISLKTLQQHELKRQ